MTYCLGVDLGTTFVAAAVARPTGVRTVTLGERSVVTPAVVHVCENGRIMTGDAAERRALGHPDRVGREVKRALGDPTPVRLGTVAYPVSMLLGAQLRDVVQKVVDVEGGPPECVVLTHPAHWGPHRRDLFREVAAAAGLESAQLVTEAEAVAHHALWRLADGATAAVYDLGGGSFDATVVRRRADGFEILGTPEGIDTLGGVDFDEAILAYVDRAAGGGLTDLDPGDVQTAVAVARLRQDCVLAKETLSLDTEAVIPVFLPGEHFEVRLTRAAFEDLVRDSVEATVDALRGTVQSAGLGPSDLDAVFLAGGSSRIPLVAEAVSQALGRPTGDSVHPKYAVALGAAAIAAASAAAPRARGGDGAAAPAGQPDEVGPPVGPVGVVALPADEPADPAGSRPEQPEGPEEPADLAEPPTVPAEADEIAAPPADQPTTVLHLPPRGVLEEAPEHRATSGETVASDGQAAATGWDGASGRDPLDEPTVLLDLPESLPVPPAAPLRGSRSRVGSRGVVLAAAAAVLVLVLVFLLAPGRTAEAPTAPGATPSPVTTTAPAGGTPSAGR
jgi:actin-like ATPase involved in cell morphogenesis